MSMEKLDEDETLDKVTEQTIRAYGVAKTNYGIAIEKKGLTMTERLKTAEAGIAAGAALRSRIRELTESNQAAVFQQDVGAILLALGLGDHARPISAHSVVQNEILPTIALLRETR